MMIQQAELSDCKEILNLQYLAYQSEAKLLNNPDIPPLRQTLDEVEREFRNGIILKATDMDNTIIGSVRAYTKDGTLYIGKLIVRPDRQGQGIGTKLLSAIENVSTVKRCELFTSSKSVKNIRLYKRLGYDIFTAKTVPPSIELVYMEKRLD